MKVLINSGGTKIKIDRVRSITNMSKGTFGSQIANTFLSIQNNVQVHFLAAKDSKMPKLESDPYPIRVGNMSYSKCFSSYSFSIFPYVTFNDYEKTLFDLLTYNSYDIIILAAAVSDYGVENYVDGKIRSSSDEMIIKLKPLPKLISKVREYAPNSFIVGFKLLVDSTEEELKQACINSMNKNKLDMIVGNDLRDIQQDNHTLTLGMWNKDKTEVLFEKYSKNQGDLSNYLKNKILEKLN